MHMALSELADWWDGNKKESEKILMDWVGENPQWWAIGVATAVQTSMELGAGFVDVLRLGEGAAKGGVSGYGMDALRLLAILGPLGRAGSLASRTLTPLAQAGRLRLAVAVKGVSGPCTFQAVNNAMAITKGKSLFVTVADMAEALGKPIKTLANAGAGKLKLGAWIDDLISFLRSAGARIREVKGLTTIEQVVAVARNETAPVVFAIKTTVTTAAGEAKTILHTVIATRSPTGAVRFADYGGKYFASLTDLVSRWGKPAAAIELYQKGVSAAVINGATLTGELSTALSNGAILVLEGLHAIETEDNGVELALPATFAATSLPLTTDPATADVVKGSFAAYKSRVVNKKVIQMPPMYITAGAKVAPSSTLLTGVQFRLNALGFGAGIVDGVVGNKTIRAIKAFQGAHPPLKADGIPGPLTQAKLKEAAGY
jgi:Putative peptidoglycan binding domain